MQTLTPMFGSGVKYSLPADKVDSFKQDFGDQAEDGVSFRTNDGKSYTIPRSKVDAFKADFPESEEVRTFKMADGTKKQMTVPEVSKFIRSKEYRESQDFADERKRIEEALPAPTVKEDGRTFSDELSASGGGAVGKTVGSVISGLFSAFGQQLRNAAVASPLGMPGQTIHGGDPKKVQATMQNNAADRAGNVVRDWTDIIFPDVEASNGFQEANKKAVEFGTGLAKFGIMASNPLSLAALVAESYGNAATETFDTGIRNGMSVEDASGLANIRGLVDGGITAAFAGAPVKRLAGALGLKTPEVVAPKVASVIKNGIGAAKNSLSAGIAKAMAVEAGKAAIEMGSLSFAQGMFDNAVMQEAEHPDKPIDWMAAAKAGGIDGLEQATVGAVLGLLPTPVRISRARRGLEKGMRDALSTPEGVAAYYSQNREGAAGLIKAFNKNGKISRTDAREAGLPEMSEVERNELAKNLTEKLKEEVAPVVEKQKVAEERRAAEAKMEAEGHKAASIRGMEERAKRKAEMAEYEKAEAERKAREAAEEAGALEVGQEAAIEEAKQTNARASVEAETNAAPKSRTEEYPEYATWLKHKFRTDTDKNWNRFVAENGLDPSLKVERGRNANVADGNGKMVEAKQTEQPVAEAPKTPVEASVEEAVKPIDQTAPKAVEGTEAAKLQTPAEIRDTMKDDAVLKRIDAAYKKAKTDAERNALEEQFKARVDELRKEQAKTDTETQKLTQEVSKNDGVEVKTDNEISPITGKPYKSDSPWIGEQGGGMNFDKAHADEAVEQMNRQAEEMKMPVRFEKDPTGRVVVSYNPHYGYGSEYQMAESVFNALMNGKRLAVGAFKPNNTASTSTSAPKPDGKGKMVSPKTIATKAEEVSQTTEVTKKPDGKGRMVKKEVPVAQEVPATPHSASAPKKVEPPSKSSLVKMKVENVIALPDGIEKYRELRARAGLRYGHTRNSGSGQMAAREYERMDKDGWGDMWNAQMSWAMADKKTRGEPPPDNLEEFKKWKSEREGIAPKKVESTAPTAKKSAESVKGRPSNLSAITENANSSTLAVIKGRSEKGVFPDEVIIMPNGHGVKQQGRESEKSPCVLFRYKTDGKDTVGHPLYGDVDAITKWAEENGMSVTRQIAKSEEPVQRVPDGKGRMKKESVSDNKITEEYPTVVDKSGKRRLTGIAAQRKAASDAEKAQRSRFANEELNGAGEFPKWNERGRLFSEPPFKTVRNANGRGTHKEYYGDPAAEAINHALDGLKGTEREKMEDLLFGKKGNRVSSSTVGNDTVYQNNDYERVISDFMRDYDRYREFVERGGKTSEELAGEAAESEARAREIKIDGDSYDIEDIEAHKRSDEIYNNAAVEVDKFDSSSPEVKNFSRDELRHIKKGDTIRFDHQETEWVADGEFDAKNGEIVVSMKDMADNPLFTEAETAEMRGRRFRITENGWIELKEKKNGNQSKNGAAADDSFAGDAKGKQDGFVLEGGTAEEIAAEQRRIVDRKEIERRQNAPLKTGKGEVGQDLLDLGGAEGEDLFNRVNKQTDSVSSDSLKTAKKLLKEKFYADEKTLMREMKALPSQANDLRVAYETAISEAKKRNATPNDVTSDTSNGGAYRGNLDQIADRTSMHRLDPKKRSEPAVLAWAKKRGRVVDNGMVTADARREYDREQAMGAAKLSRNWFPDMKVTYHDYGENVKRGQHVLDLRDRSGNTLGWFDPNNKEVHLLPGANAETVAHEIMWHGTRDWANTEAAKGNTEATRLLNKMHEVENACPASLKKAILRAYRKTGVTDPDTLLNEFGAWDAMVNGGNALGKELQKRENAVWYARWWNAAKDIIKSYLARHGKNRVDFTDIDGMTTDEFKDFLAEQFAGGKTLGEIVPKAGKTVSTDETKLQKARRIIYDVNAPIRDLERDIEKAHGVKIKFEESAEAANALTPGLREAELLATSASEREYREILDAGKLSNADVEAYMGAKAAAGRDAKVDAKNLAQIAKDVERDLRAEWGTDKIAKDTAAFDAELQNRVSSAQAAYNSTNGSHIDPREARMTVSETENGLHKTAYADARKKLRAVMDETLQVQKDAGLISEELYNKLKTEEPDYVPFKNEYDLETSEHYGRGVNNFTKPEFYEARGRQSAAGDIVTHIFQDNLAAKHRAIENGVREKLAKLVERFPELGTVEKVGEAWKEKQKDTSDWFDKSNKHGEHNVVIFKRNGDTYAIRLNGTRGAAIAAGITERNVMRFSGKIGEVFNKFSRFQAGLATRYAPFFAFRNLPKDNIELGNIVLSERGLLEGSRWIKDYVASYKDTAGALSKFVLTGKVDASTPGGQVLQRYIDAGGLISGGGTEGYDAHSIRTRMDPKFIEKEMKRGRSKTYATLQYAKRGLGYLSEMSELMTRVNAFNAELKAGKSDGEASLFSRRATVDFNRHGELTGVTNVLRLFSNSTLGATARATAALANSKGGRTMAAILFANGMARVALEHLMNDDDDKGREAAGTGTCKDVPEYERQTSLFYVRNGENIFKIAEHESPFSLITYAGDTLARVLYGDISVGQAAKNLGISTTEVAYGLTGLGSINLTSREGGLDNDITAAAVSGIVPSIMQPIAEVWSGIDYKGDPISMQLFDTTDVRSHHPRANTPDYQVKTAQFLNRITGGNAGRRGYADLAPEAVGKLIEGYGKNALREGLMAYDLAKAMVGDKKWSDVDVGQKPLVRDWVRPIRGNTNRYYDAKRTRKEDRKDFDANRATMSVEERYAYATSHPSAVGRRSEAMSKMETSIQRLQKMERGFIYKNGKAVPHEWSDEKINELEKRRLELQAKYIKLMETQTNQ